MHGDKVGTSNVGVVAGANGGPAGDATNVVTDYVRVRGESRSHDAKFHKEITAAYKAAFTKAQRVDLESNPLKTLRMADGKTLRVPLKAKEIVTVRLS